nr:hypothetical protein [Orientia tsutsugamushi]
MNGVLISGTLRYWFSDSKHIAVDKTYFLTYKRTPNYLLLKLLQRIMVELEHLY